MPTKIATFPTQHLHAVSGREQFQQLLEVPVSAEEIRATLTPPLHFANARFENYTPSSDYPSQSEAMRVVAHFVQCDTQRPGLLNSLRSRFGTKSGSERRGVYLDGGFGVGKTHLLAAAYHSFLGRKAYLSFQELMFLVGLERLDNTLEAFRAYELLAIDEFELDDPANTRIASTLISGLLTSGVKILATSNTPPGAVAEGKFSTADFQRELGELAGSFLQVRIEGEDYRVTHHKQAGSVGTWFSSSDARFEGLSKTLNGSGAALLDLQWQDLISLLSSHHPIRVRRVMSMFDAVILRHLEAFQLPYDALRFVYFVDKAYDANLEMVVSSDILVQDIFPHAIYNGGDTKKYLRTVSRLREMTSG